VTVYIVMRRIGGTFGSLSVPIAIHEEERAATAHAERLQRATEKLVGERVGARQTTVADVLQGLGIEDLEHTVIGKAVESPLALPPKSRIIT